MGNPGSSRREAVTHLPEKVRQTILSNRMVIDNLIVRSLGILQLKTIEALANRDGETVSIEELIELFEHTKIPELQARKTIGSLRKLGFKIITNKGYALTSDNSQETGKPSDSSNSAPSA